MQRSLVIAVTKMFLVSMFFKMKTNEKKEDKKKKRIHFSILKLSITTHLQ